MRSKEKQPKISTEESFVLGHANLPPRCHYGFIEHLGPRPYFTVCEVILIGRSVLDKALDMCITYLPLLRKYLKVALVHLGEFPPQRWSDFAVEVVKKVLSPDSQSVGIVWSKSLHSM